MEDILIVSAGAVLAFLLIVTVVYKMAPYRELGVEKPGFVLFPKYKNEVDCLASGDRVEAVMASLGFDKKSVGDGMTRYSRGSLTKDLSIEKLKINVTFSSPSDGKLPYVVEAAWLAVVDTGDHWKLAKELGDRIASA